MHTISFKVRSKNIERIIWAFNKAGIYNQSGADGQFNRYPGVVKVFIESIDELRAVNVALHTGIVDNFMEEIEATTDRVSAAINVVQWYTWDQVYQTLRDGYGAGGANNQDPTQADATDTDDQPVSVDSPDYEPSDPDVHLMTEDNATDEQAALEAQGITDIANDDVTTKQGEAEANDVPAVKASHFTTAKPTAKPVAKSAAKTTVKPTAKPVAKSAAKTTVKPTAKPVAKGRKTTS